MSHKTTSHPLITVQVTFVNFWHLKIFNGGRHCGVPQWRQTEWDPGVCEESLPQRGKKAPSQEYRIGSTEPAPPLLKEKSRRLAFSGRIGLCPVPLWPSLSPCFHAEPQRHKKGTDGSGGDKFKEHSRLSGRVTVLLTPGGAVMGCMLHNTS